MVYSNWSYLLNKQKVRWVMSFNKNNIALSMPWLRNVFAGLNNFHNQACDAFLASFIFFSVLVQIALIFILFLVCMPILIASLTFSGFLQWYLSSYLNLNAQINATIFYLMLHDPTRAVVSADYNWSKQSFLSVVSLIGLGAQNNEDKEVF